MWDFFKAIFDSTGVVGLACALEAILLFIVLRAYQKKDVKIEDLQNTLLKMSEQRREDIVEEREKYEELSKDLHKSLDILIQVFKRRNGNNGH